MQTSNVAQFWATVAGVVIAYGTTVGCSSSGGGATDKGDPKVDGGWNGAAADGGGDALISPLDGTVSNDAALLNDGSNIAPSGDANGGNDASGVHDASDATVPNDASDAGSGNDPDGATPPNDANDAAVADGASACVPSLCTSGVCGADGGGCLPPCSASNLCEGALSCCSGRCVDPAHDSHNCGTCGNDCSSLQFCTGTSCVDQRLANVCRNAQAVVLQDDLGPDDLASKVLGAGLSACVPAVAVRYALQDAGDLDPTTHAPLAGPGQTCAAAGGSYGQQLIGYINQTSAPVIATDDGTNAAFVIADGGAQIVEIANSAITATHDYFLVALATDPGSGTLVVSAYGFLEGGTSAAAWYFTNVMVPSLPSFTQRWYVYEWIDSNGAGPDPTDTFRLLSSGI